MTASVVLSLLLLFFWGKKVEAKDDLVASNLSIAIHCYIDGTGNDSTTMASTASNLGCVARSLIPHEQSFLVEFQHETSHSADLCLETCASVYENASFALVSWDSHNKSLDCYCTLATETFLTQEILGPDIFCNEKCTSEATPQKFNMPCGGTHVFEEGTVETFFNVYCLRKINGTYPPVIPGQPTLPPPTASTSSTTPSPNPTTTTTASEGSSTKGPTDGTGGIKPLLRDILATLVHTNVLSIILIGLIVMLVVLMVILLIWTWMFMESFDPSEDRNTGTNKQPILQTISGNRDLHDTSTPGYGTTNQAFDPTPETNPHGVFSASRLSTFDRSNNSSFEGETDDSDKTPRVEENPEFITREGRSTFYGDKPENPENSGQNKDPDTVSVETELEEVGDDERPKSPKGTLAIEP